MAALDGPSGLSLNVDAWGPDFSRLRDIIASLPLLQSEGVDNALRTLAVGPTEGPEKSWRAVPDTFQAELYSPGSHDVIALTGPIDRPELAQLVPTATGPLAPPSIAEVAQATQIVAAHKAIAPGITNGTTKLVSAMPGAVQLLGPDGSLQRGVAIGVQERLPADAVTTHRTALVDLVNNGVLFHPPATGDCGSPDDGDHGDNSTTGTVDVAVTQNGEELWHFVVVRPAQTHTPQGIGLSVRFVSYRGREVLYRGDTPIVNVLYDAPNASGATSYRDWMWEEAALDAVGIDVIPGYRLCSSPPTTLFDPDGAGKTRAGGNFNGVTFHFDNDTLVVTSLMRAGWYRYRMEWRFRADGTIQPTFGFAAVVNPNTCSVHTHHCYWRFDFDIEGAANNRVDAGSMPFFGFGGVGGGPGRLPFPRPTWQWATAATETKWQRALFLRQAWRVVNTQTGRGYVVHPGNDGFADNFGVGDVWALRYHPGEDKDAGGGDNMAHIDPYLNGEDISNADVVVWYAAHARHDAHADEAANQHGHVVGPTLSPLNW